MVLEMIKKMKAVIIAAGEGSRLNHVTNGRPKPLTPLLGVPILERIIKTAKLGNIKEFIIVTGFEGQQIRDYFQDGKKLGVKIEYIENQDWKKGNGLSVLRSKEKVLNSNNGDQKDDHFFIFMADHIFDPRIIQNMPKFASEHDSFSIILAGDPMKKATDDDTKVLTENRVIKKIGKAIEEFDYVDTGIFYCTPKIFDFLEKAADQDKTELSEAIQMAANENEAFIMDITEMETYVSKLRKDVKPYWIDIDTPEDLKRAGKMIVENASKNPSDLLATYVHKPIENKIVAKLAKHKITPNQVTIIVNIFAYLVTGLYFFNYLLAGIILAFIVGILDGLDGKLARVKMQTSLVGSMEHAYDLLYEFSWIAVFAWDIYTITNRPYYIMLGMLSIIFISFYRMIYDHFRKGAGRSLDDSGRFERVFRRFAGRRNLYNIPILIFVLLNEPWWAVWCIFIHAAITAIVYAQRSYVHLKQLDKTN
ncbi:MAG: sugar phosphate nucleotidyltransferase [Promethearchaeota archaeon]